MFTTSPAVSWPNVVLQPEVSRAEFETLKRQVEEMTALLKKAREYDDRTGQPDCETDEKVDLLRKVAKLVGINPSELA